MLGTISVARVRCVSIGGLDAAGGSWLDAKTVAQRVERRGQRDRVIVANRVVRGTTEEDLLADFVREGREECEGLEPCSAKRRTLCRASSSRGVAVAKDRAAAASRRSKSRSPSECTR